MCCGCSCLDKQVCYGCFLLSGWRRLFRISFEPFAAYNADKELCLCHKEGAFLSIQSKFAKSDEKLPKHHHILSWRGPGRCQCKIYWTSGRIVPLGNPPFSWKLLSLCIKQGIFLKIYENVGYFPFVAIVSWRDRRFHLSRNYE